MGQVLLLVLGLDQCAQTTGSKFPRVQNTHYKNILMCSNIALHSQISVQAGGGVGATLTLPPQFVFREQKEEGRRTESGAGAKHRSRD